MANPLASDAFELECLRSERRRAVWVAGVIASGAAIGLARRVLGSAGASELPILWMIAIAGVMIAYEVGVFVVASRAVRASRPFPPALRLANVLLEPQFLTALLIVQVTSGIFGPFGALSGPLTLMYLILIALAALRMSPVLCWIAAGASAVGYAAAVAIAFASADGLVPPYHPAVYASIAAVIVLAGLASGAVAGGIRAQVRATVQEHFERERDRERARHNLIFALAQLAEHRDTDTGEHLVRIASYVEILARSLAQRDRAIDTEWITTLRVASSMHDIGKVGIPDAILQKPARLADDELTVMRTHAAIGADLLASIRTRQGDDPLLAMSEAIAREHHERWDGQGYPAGLRESEISLAARITAVADVYDALTSVRVYKPAMTHTEALAILREGAGSHFDPAIIEALARCEPEFDRVRSAAQSD